jgi:hypothetical protein
MKYPTTPRSIAALKLSRKGIVLISIAKTIVLAVSGNKSFPKPDSTIAVLNAAIADLETAETTVQSRAKGAVAARDQKRSALILLVEQLRAYVQKITDADSDHATELIQSAAMSVKKVPSATSGCSVTKPGALSGSVALVTPSAGHRRRTNGSTLPTAARRGKRCRRPWVRRPACRACSRGSATSFGLGRSRRAAPRMEPARGDGRS